MGKFYTLLVAASLLSATAFAQTSILNAKQEKQEKGDLPMARLTTKHVKNAQQTNMKAKDFHSVSNIANPFGPMKADATETLITEQPEGTLYKNMNYNSYSYYVYWGYVFYGSVEFYARNIVEAADGSVYLENPFSSLLTNSWLKGEKGEGDTIVVKLPQLIYEEDYYGEHYSYYASKLNYDSEQGWYYQDTDDNELKFIWRNDSLVLATDAMLGLVNTDGEWTGYGEEDICVTTIPFTANTLPDDVSLNDYVIKSFSSDDADATYTGSIIKAGAKGSDFYISGVASDYISDAVIKGTISGSNITIDPIQYLGVDTVDMLHAFSVSADITDVYYEDYDYWYETAAISSDPIVFTYDDATGAYKSEKDWLINVGYTSVSALDYYRNPEFLPFIEVAATPADPTISSYNLLDESYGYGYAYMYFDVYTTDVDGNFINPNKTFFNIWIDDELYTFYPDEYVYFTEELTDVPVNYTDGWDLYVSGTTHTLYLWTTGFEKIGVQTIYKGGDETRKSNIVYYNVETGDITTGIKSVEGTNGDVKSVKYIDLSGRMVSNPDKGIYIKSITYSDGTTKNVKVINK
ncbi:MAG: hypothetical protein Q4D41_11540 [Prevotellaceae bacterium]|nr:hypothetical protein [Prevotellaceae bacterium]